VPNNKALRRQQELSLKPEDKVIHNLLRDGEVPCETVLKNGRVFVPTGLLAQSKRLDPTPLGKSLRAYKPDHAF